MDNRKIPSENKVYGKYRVGMIQMVAGGELQLKETDTVDNNESGILIVHGEDEAENITFVPWTNVGMVRTWIPPHNRRKREQRAIESERRRSHPVIDVDKLRELHS